MMRHPVLTGLAAGAAGTTALNTTTYLDMLLRARPPSSTPEETVRTFEKLTGYTLSAEGPDSDRAGNRRSGLGALLGIAAGLGTGALYGLLRPRLRRVPVPLLALGVGLVANAGTTGPMAVLGVTDPRGWSKDSWLADLTPHLVYGLATALVFEAAQQ
jgi:hypothetical protein